MELPEYIKGVIFDLDGTLLDSLHVWQDVDRRFFEKRGMEIPPDFFEAVMVRDLTDAAAYTKERYGFPETREELVEEWLSMIRAEYAERVALKPFAGEYVKKLHAEGYRIGLATSASRDLYLPALTRHGLAGYFSSFTETRETVRGKDSPDPYLLAAKKLGLPPQVCAVFEDIPLGIASAKAGGFFAVAVADPMNRVREAELRAGADLFIASFSELLGGHEKRANGLL